nr:chitobiase/beta-hexosaminidase C-terminal domain-containing protein [Lachnospiraceae bacterium]
VTVIKAETPDAKYSATCTVRVTVPATAQAPTASVKPGEVNKGTKVLLSTSAYGAKIYYTTDGSVPSYDAAGKPLATTKIYNDAIIIEKNVVIKAIAVCDGYKDSAVATFEYTVKTASWGDIENDKEVKDIFKDVSEVPEGMWFALDGKAYRLNDKINFSIAYTGDKITFNDRIKVYDSTKRLWENTDYTVTYKNNQAVASKDAGKKAPLFIIKGKGNYEKAAEFAFDIVAADINSAKLISEKNICVNPGTKLGSVKPQLSFNGKKLTAGKDFTLSFVNGISADTKAAAGETYEISIIGKGSFTDTFGDKLTVKAVDPKDSSVMAMTKIKVSVPKAKDLPYDKNGYDLVALFDNSNSKAAKVAVLNGKVSLEYGKDFTVSSSDADANGIITAAGKHSVTVHGKGKYVGDKVAILEISGIPANKVKITGLNTNAEYTGKAYTLPDGVKLTSALGNLEQGKDYDVEIHDNGSVGKVNVVFTFKGQYTGTVKKVINVKAKNISSAKITVSDAQYSKSGAVPESVTVKIDNETLIEGIDYTLSYKNNAKVADKNSGKSAPVVVVKGKGNYTGSKSEFFTVGKADITKCVSLVSVDKVYSEKAGSFRSEPKLTDNSKAIALGKDIDKFDKKTAFKYCYAANGEEIPANAVVPADTIIEVRLTVNCGPQSPYKAGKYELKGYYKILGKGFDIKAAKVSVKDPDKLRFNNGKEIIPDLVVTMNNKPLGKDDYEIVSISSNRFLGTASVTIRGKGKYGGTNTFKFKIGARSIFG